jgi:hypothetical protein
MFMINNMSNWFEFLIWPTTETLESDDGHVQFVSASNAQDWAKLGVAIDYKEAKGKRRNEARVQICL